VSSWPASGGNDGAAHARAAAWTLPVPNDATVTDVLAAVGDLEPSERSDLVVVLDALDKAKAPRGSGGPSYAEYVPKPAAKTLSQLNRSVQSPTNSG
jgi:hypothetical protein